MKEGQRGELIRIRLNGAATMEQRVAQVAAEFREAIKAYPNRMPGMGRKIRTSYITRREAAYEVYYVPLVVDRDGFI